MDRKLMLAVAGSGKTTFLVSKLDLEHRFLIVTYTNNNVENLRRAIIGKFSYFPNNIKLLSYFQFLLNVCYKPFLLDELKAKGIDWKMPPEITLRYKRTNLAFYMTRNKFLYHNRIAKLCQNIATEITQRIDKYFDCFYFDEVQDLAGHDFDLVSQIIPKQAKVLFVGDFYQHTFDTSRDGNVNCNLYDDYYKYIKRWEKAGLVIDVKELKRSHRCSKTVCDFVRDKLNINIYANKENISNIEYIQLQNRADEMIQDSKIPILFYQERSKYNCFSMNWGESKGLDDFVDVCIVLNKKTKELYEKDKLNELPQSTKNKFYVACTRAKRDLYFIPFEYMEKYKIS